MIKTISAPISKGFIGDLLLGLLSVLIGLRVASGGDDANFEYGVYFQKVSIYLVCLLGALLASKSWRNVWRWTSLQEIVGVINTAIGASFSYALITYLNFKNISAAEIFYVLFPMLALMLGARGFVRLFTSGGNVMALSALFRPIEKKAPSAILIGSTDIITHSLHEMRKLGSLPIRPIAIISTSGNQIGKAFAGAIVHSGEVIETLLPHLIESNLTDRNDVRLVFVGDKISNSAKQAALAAVAKYGVKLSRLPEVGSKELTKVNAQDVLGRSRHIANKIIIEKLLRHKSVLLTGAGGTIGSELAKQIAANQPGKLILVENSESNLYTISQFLSEEFPNVAIEAHMIDVRDKEDVEALFKKNNPQIVIHAAANKHVPILESHPKQAISVNLGGTKVVADAAQKFGADVFILISTDKAVNPNNMMGAAKRAAELYIRSCFEIKKGHFYSVRFGNVLGSSGSVMPLFERQIAKNGPVTVTHREMTRWFMTVEEAVSLVLQGAALGAGYNAKGEKTDVKLDGPLLVLDMGEPVRIWDFAEAMVRLMGLEPHKDIRIIETGIRPGEKLHEELFYASEHVCDTEIDGIYCAKTVVPLSPNLADIVSKTVEYADKNNIDAAVKLLIKIVPETKLNHIN